MSFLNVFFSVLVACFFTSGIKIGESHKSDEAPHTTTLVKWVVQKSSVLQVQGKSNINEFTCAIEAYTKKDTIVCIAEPFKPIKLSGRLQMDVLSFDCQNSLITNNLRKTLKADEYPKMIIRFLSLQTMPLLQHKTEFIKGWIEVELAGVVKQFELCYTFSNTEPGTIQLIGGRNFCFTDFKLSPPQKMGGLIKIKDDFAVKFQLNLRAI